MKKRTISLCLIITAIMAGCSVKSTQSLPAEIPTLEYISARPALLTETLRPVLETASPAAPPSPTPVRFTATVTPTNLPTVTATISPGARLDIQCLNITDSLPETGLYSGTVVLGGYSEDPSYLLNLSTGIMRPLLKENERKSMFESVSPNRKWLAYLIVQQDLLVVETVGEKVKSIRILWEKDWEFLNGWLDDQNLWIVLDKGPDLLLNPFTGKRKELRYDFPDIAPPIGVGVDYWGPAIFNPSLTRAVYPRIGGRIVLWDLRAHRAVAYLESENNPFGGKPMWSPNGEEFVISLQHVVANVSLTEELYRVTEDGQKTKITNLSAYYSKQLSIAAVAWSPDATQIAFWINYGWEKHLDKVQLAILNLATMQVTNYCINGDFAGNEPVWSPDGRQLVVEAYFDNDRVTLLIDPEKKLAFKIAGHFKPSGWMK